jgi:hypothetical protein
MKLILAFATGIVLAVSLSVGDLAAQTKADKVRIGYAARAVAHSVPYVARPFGRSAAAVCPAPSVDEFRGSILTEIDKSGFIDKLYGGQVK